MVALKVFLVMTIIGAFSSGIGGVISCVIKTNSKNMISALYDLTAGIMTAIVCFDMIPECFEISNLPITITGIIIGVIIIIIIEKCANKLNNSKYSRLSFMIIIAMAFHNFIEGIAIGSSYMYSFALGTTILISMILHDIPEGMVVGITSKVDIKDTKKTMLNSVLAGVFTGVGALVGYLMGGINRVYIAICLSIAAGSMLYIVSCDLIPSSKNISKNKKVYIMYIVGILIGAIITKI